MDVAVRRAGQKNEGHIQRRPHRHLQTNFVIALAPYFFPLYAVIVIFIFAIGHLIWDWKNYFVIFICSLARRMRFMSR